MEEKYLVFVYGTLMSGYWNNRILEQGGAELIGKGETTNSFIMLASGGNGIPFVVDFTPETYPTQFWLENCSPIKGEVWKVDAKTLEALDGLEGHPNWYKREEVVIKTEESRVINRSTYGNPIESYLLTAWCYLMPLSDKEMKDNMRYPIVVASGDYNDLP